MAGTDRNRPMLSGGPAIILVEPQLGDNIGMVARAMANFGLSELRLVNPRDGWPNERARAAASRADHVIDGVKLYATLEEALADLRYVLMTTARERDGHKPVLSPVEAARELRARENMDARCGIVFGRERFGLFSAEIGLGDAIVTFPVNPAFASLNLAQAVLLMAYEWMKSGLESETDTAFRGPEQMPASKDALYNLFEHLEEALAVRGYFRPPSKHPAMVDNLRAVLTRPGFSEAELRVLRGVISSLDRFTPDRPRGQAGGEDAGTREGGTVDGRKRDDSAA